MRLHIPEMLGVYGSESSPPSGLKNAFNSPTFQQVVLVVSFLGLGIFPFLTFLQTVAAEIPNKPITTGIRTFELSGKLSKSINAFGKELLLFNLIHSKLGLIRKARNASS